MKGAFLAATDDPEAGSVIVFTEDVPAAFCFLLFISNCKAAARLPLELEVPDSSEGQLEPLLFLESLVELSNTVSFSWMISGTDLVC